MRNNKGYRKEKQVYPLGVKKTLEQVMSDIDKEYNLHIKNIVWCYERIRKMENITKEQIRDYLNKWMLLDCLDRNGELIPFEETIQAIEHERDRKKQSASYQYFRRIVNKDNQKYVYNSSGGGFNLSTVRIPSMKRSNATWNRFYELFPVFKEHYDEINNKNGVKLKKTW